MMQKPRNSCFGPASMDWYLTVKFVHVAAAMAWAGGVLTMLLITLILARDPDLAPRLRFVALMNRLSPSFFAPASTTVLVSGLVLGFLWTGFSEAWLALGLAGMAASIGIGAGVIKPVGERVTARARAEGASPAVLADIETIARVGRFECAIMMAVVALMVFKPGWQDTPMLFALALLLAVAGALFLIPRRSDAAYRRSA